MAPGHLSVTHPSPWAQGCRLPQGCSRTGAVLEGHAPGAQITSHVTAAGDICDGKSRPAALTDWDRWCGLSLVAGFSESP